MGECCMIQLRWIRASIVLLMLYGMNLPVPAIAQIGEINEATQRYKEEWERGNYQSALDQLNELMLSRPDLEKIRAYRYLQWLDDRANLLFLLGDVDGAIADMTILADRIREPASTFKLAEYHHYKGDIYEYEQLLNRAMQEVQSRWYFYYRGDNVAAIAKVSERLGENPKMLLSSYYGTLIDSYPEFIAGYTGAGELAMKKGDYGMAEDYFVKALVVDEKNQIALAGLAECYQASGDPRANEIVDKLLTINPMNYRGNAVLIESHLESDHIDEAITVIDEALKVNPNQLEILALKATAFFLQDKLEEMREVQNQIVSYNPYYSGAYRVPGKMASQKYRFKEGVELQEKALALNPKDIEAKAQYALDLMRLGREEEGRQELDAVFKADPFNVQVFNLLEMLDTLNTYNEIDTGAFIIKMPKQESPILKDEVISLLKRAYDKYQFKYDIDLETPVYIEIFDHHDDFMVRSVGLPGSVGFMGICFGHLVTMDSPTARPEHTMNWRSVLWHEFVHVITLQKTKNRMPRWLSEGISVYEETEYSPAFGQKFDPSYKSLVDLDDLPGMMELELMFTQPKSSNDIQLGYFMSGEFAKFYMNRYGKDAMNPALDAIGQGADTTKALADGAKQTVDEVNNAFHDYLRSRLSILDNIPDVPEEEPHEDVMEIVQRQREQGVSWYDYESKYTNAVREAVKLVKEMKWDEAEALFTQAQELFPEMTGAHSPLVQLTHVYKESGQTEKLKETLWQIMDFDPANYPAALELIKLLVQDEDWQGVETVCSWAIGIDPFDPEILTVHQRALVNTASFDQAAEVAQKRIHIEPSYAIEHRIDRITYLQKAQEYHTAKQELLELLEEYPHYWNGQKLLLEMTGNLN